MLLVDLEKEIKRLREESTANDTTIVYAVKESGTDEKQVIKVEFDDYNHDIILIVKD